MSRILTALLLALCALSARAQINVFHVFTPAAKTYLNQIGMTQAQYIAQQINDANPALSSSGVNASFTTPSNPQFYDLPLSGAMTPVMQAALNLTVASLRDVTASDIVVLVDDFGSGAADELPSTRGSTTVLSEGYPFDNSPSATAGVNVRSSTATPKTYNWMHVVLDHIMHAGHERHPNDDPNITNRGYSFTVGSTYENCETVVDITGSRYTADRSFRLSTCSGWGIENPGQGQIGFYCSASGWCAAFGQSPSGQNGYQFNGYTAFQGVITGTAPDGYPQCAVQALPPQGTNLQTVNGSQMGPPHQGSNGWGICMNPVRVSPRVAGPGVKDPVTNATLGSQFENNVAHLNSVAAFYAGRHNTPRRADANRWRCVYSGLAAC